MTDALHTTIEPTIAPLLQEAVTNTLDSVIRLGERLETLGEPFTLDIVRQYRAEYAAEVIAKAAGE